MPPSEADIMEAIGGVRSQVQSLASDVHKIDQRLERLETSEHTREIREAEERGRMSAKGEVVFPQIFTYRNLTTAGSILGLVIAVLRVTDALP